MPLEEVGARLSLKDRRKFSAEIARVKHDLKELQDEVGKTGRTAATAGGHRGGGFGILSRSFGVVSRGAKTGVLALGGITTAAVVLGVKTRASMEQAEIGFTTMLGSGERAKRFMSDLRGFAEKTPFELPDVVTGAQRLLAYGFAADKILPTLTSIGDASAALGLGAEGIDRITTAIGQIKAKGAVQAEEMRQLAESGVPAWDMLAKKLGVDIPTAMSIVESRSVSSATGIAAITEGINKRFGGLMEKQSRSIGGLWSTLVDTVRNGLSDAILPFQDDLKHGMDWAIAYVKKTVQKLPVIAGRVREQMPNIFAGLAAGDASGVTAALEAIIGGDLSPRVQQVVQGLMDLWTILRDGILPGFMAWQVMVGPALDLASGLLRVMATHADHLVGPLALLGFLWGVHATTVGLTNLAMKAYRGYIVIVSGLTKTWTAAQWLLNAAMLANPYVLMAVLIAVLIAEFVLLYKKFDGFRGLVDNTFGWIKTNWPDLLGILLFPFGGFVILIVRYWDEIQDGMSKASDWIVDRVRKLPGDLLSAASGLWDWIPEGARGAANLAVAAINEVIDLLNTFEIHASTPGLSVGGHDIIPGWSYDWNGLNLGHLQQLARGGLVRARPGGTLALMAEAGQDELTIPVSRRPDVTPLDKLNLAALFGGGGPDEFVGKTPIYLDGRKIGEANIRYVRDRAARR